MATLALPLVKLRDQVNRFAPNRSKISDGWIGDAAHQAVPSDHNPNADGVVCALDITHDVEGGLDAHSLADRLLAKRHPQLKYIISKHRIAGGWTGWKWVKYSGDNPHDKHIHVSVGVGDDGQSKPGSYDDSVTKWNVEGEDMPKATFEDVKYGYAFIAGELRTDQQVRDSGWIGTDLLEFYQKLMKHVSDNTIDYGRYRKWAEAEINQLKGNVGLTQELAEKVVARAYRAATDIDPTADQAGYWVPRIKANPAEINNLLDGLGAKDYQGDASFRSKARNYDADVKKATESNEAGRKLQAIKDILK